MPKRLQPMNPERVFIDTSLFLRYLTNDVPKQADAVEQLLHRAASGQITLVANVMVIAEIVWTLESFYNLPKAAIQEKILSILNTPGIEVEEYSRVLQAVVTYAEQNVDFIDAYNAAWLLDHDMNLIYTFDRKHFSRLTGISVRVPE